MKPFLLFLFCIAILNSSAQVNTNMPPEASLFSLRSMAAIKPETKNLVNRYALQFKEKKMNTSDLLLRLKKEPSLQILNRHDIAGIAVLILVKVSVNTDEVLKKKVMHHRNNPSPDIIKETKELTDYKSLLARNVEQIINENIVSHESVVNHLK